MPTMGLIALPGAAVRTYAPSPPPIMPAGASFQKRCLSRFPNRQCDNPEAPVVNTSAACTLALAVAGGIPRLRRTVVEISPYAIPIAPSTIWAAKPMATNNRRSDTFGPSFWRRSPLGRFLHEIPFIAPSRHQHSVGKGPRNVDISKILYPASTWVIPILIAITFHEAAHALAAWKLGDDTALREGRVTLNLSWTSSGGW
jgi:hypothetical protein